MNLKQALKIMEIEDYVSINIIKEKYRELQKKYHPDVSNLKSQDKLNKVNEAYKFLIKYLENLRLDVDYLLNIDTEEEKLRRRFGSDWLSGKEI